MASFSLCGINLLFSLFSLIHFVSSQLPRNFYPRTQDLTFVIDFNKNQISGKTWIYIERESAQTERTVVFNYFNDTLELDKLVVLETWDFENRTEVEIENMQKNEMEETVELQLSETSSTKLLLEIEFTSKIEEFDSHRVGAYRMYPDSHGMATLFEMSFARRVLPCFDDPHFQTNFNLRVKLDPSVSSDCKVVLSNSPTSNVNTEKREFTFKETIPIPSYLLAIAVLNSRKHQLFIKGSLNKTKGPLIQFWSFPNQKIMTNETFYSQLIQIAADTVIKCEKEFGVDIALEKIDFVQMSLASGIAGVEHPGLVTLSPLCECDIVKNVNLQ